MKAYCPKCKTELQGVPNYDCWYCPACEVGWWGSEVCKMTEGTVAKEKLQEMFQEAIRPKNNCDTCSREKCIFPSPNPSYFCGLNDWTPTKEETKQIGKLDPAGVGIGDGITDVSLKSWLQTIIVQQNNIIDAVNELRREDK